MCEGDTNVLLHQGNNARQRKLGGGSFNTQIKFSIVFAELLHVTCDILDGHFNPISVFNLIFPASFVVSSHPGADYQTSFYVRPCVYFEKKCSKNETLADESQFSDKTSRKAPTFECGSELSTKSWLNTTPYMRRGTDLESGDYVYTSNEDLVPVGSAIMHQLHNNTATVMNQMVADDDIIMIMLMVRNHRRLTVKVIQRTKRRIVRICLLSWRCHVLTAVPQFLWET